MGDKGSPNEVCRSLPYVGKEIPMEVEKDFTVVLATCEMASTSEMPLCSTMRILEKHSDWILKRR